MSPLIKSKSKKALSENIESEMDSGMPKDRSIAVAYSVKRHAMKKKHKMAEGGSVDEDMVDSDILEPKEDESEMEDTGSIVDGIVRKRKMMAKGGEVDLQSNADEDLNMEDDLSFEAARDKTYFDDGQLEEEPLDSDEHSDELSDADKHDMVSSIRRKMKSKYKV